MNDFTRSLAVNFVLKLTSRMFIGTHITNTREAKAFALLSEEGIAKGVRRITAVTTESALKAMELGDLLLQEVDDASKMEVSLLEKVCFYTLVSKTLKLGSSYYQCLYLFLF